MRKLFCQHTVDYFRIYSERNLKVNKTLDYARYKRTPLPEVRKSNKISFLPVTVKPSTP
jgi:hypothetical protein